MDYILEEMERQRLAMERLLARVPAKQTSASQEENAALLRQSDAAEETAQTAIGTAGTLRELLRQTAEESAVSAGGMSVPPAKRRDRQTAAMRRRSLAGTMPVEADLRSGRMFVRTESAGNRAAAQEISRAVEREARRYDGGFEMY